MTAMDEQQMHADRQAWAWWNRVRRGGMPPAELEAFGERMAEPGHAEAYAACEWSGTCVQALDRNGDRQWRAWQEEALSRARAGAPKVEPLADWNSLVFRPAARAPRRRRSRVWRHAAGLAACLGLAAVLAWPWLQQPAPVLDYDAGQGTREVLLPDGTHLTLDAGSSVAYRELRDRRSLELRQGRIYLEVAKDAGLPQFLVRSGPVDTLVLGTRFQVSREVDRIEVVLEEGAVRMQRQDSGAVTTLAPGDRVWSQPDAGGFGRDRISPGRALAWTRGRLFFEDVPLSQAVVEVNRHTTGVRLELADPEVADLRVSGIFLAGDAELVAASWEATLPIRTEHHGGRITLSRR